MLAAQKKEGPDVMLITKLTGQPHRRSRGGAELLVNKGLFTNNS